MFFHRSGKEATAQEIERSHVVNATTRQYEIRGKCTRCGGAGGAEQWRHTGWTCFKCGGNGLGYNNSGVPVYEKIKLYTAEKLAALNIAESNRREKKRKANEVKRIESIKQARNKRRANADQIRAFVALAWPVRRKASFINDILISVLKLGRVSEKQIAAIQSFIDRETKKAESEFVGNVGERMQARLKITSRQHCGTRPVYGAPWKSEAITLTIFEDENGNILKTFNAISDGFRVWNAEYSEYENVQDFVAVKFTIKSHDTYKGVKQTMIQRISTKGVKA